MLECRPLDSEKQEALLLFRREQLLYDIRNIAFVEGDTMADDKYHLRHIVQDIGEEGNIDRVTRVLDLAHSECVELLFPFTKRRVIHDCLDDRLIDKKLYSIFMAIPIDFSQTTLNALEKLVHEYLVCRVIADWLDFTDAKKSAVWKEKIEGLKTAIKSKVRMSRKRTRIRNHPF